MFAAIRYFALGVYNLQIPGIGRVPLDPWFTLVCIGFVVGLEVSRHRAIKLGLDVRDVVDGAVFTVLSGFFFGHMFTVLAYYPERLRTDGIMSILRVWEGFSSMGGFLGAVIGATVFYRWVRPRDGWRHADVIMYGFPFGWVFGRLGCFVVHDHIGAVTTFPLGMYFPAHTLCIDNSGPHQSCVAWADAAIRHELGFYEALYTIGIAVLFHTLGRKDRPPGTFLAMWTFAYAPVRFVLDFLRNTDLSHQDARYLGLTPGHYSALVMLVGGAILWRTIDFRNFRPWPMDGQPDQASRALPSAAESASGR